MQRFYLILLSVILSLSTTPPVRRQEELLKLATK